VPYIQFKHTLLKEPKELTDGDAVSIHGFLLIGNTPSTEERTCWNQTNSSLVMTTVYNKIKPYCLDHTLNEKKVNGAYDASNYNDSYNKQVIKFNEVIQKSIWHTIIWRVMMNIYLMYDFLFSPSERGEQENNTFSIENCRIVSDFHEKYFSSSQRPKTTSDFNEDDIEGKTNEQRKTASTFQEDLTFKHKVEKALKRAEEEQDPSCPGSRSPTPSRSPPSRSPSPRIPSSHSPGPSPDPSPDPSPYTTADELQPPTVKISNSSLGTSGCKPDSPINIARQPEYMAKQKFRKPI
jgi:hypothetical protein